MHPGRRVGSGGAPRAAAAAQRGALAPRRPSTQPALPAPGPSRAADPAPAATQRAPGSARSRRRREIMDRTPAVERVWAGLRGVRVRGDGRGRWGNGRAPEQRPVFVPRPAPAAARAAPPAARRCPACAARTTRGACPSPRPPYGSAAIALPPRKAAAACAHPAPPPPQPSPPTSQGPPLPRPMLDYKVRGSITFAHSCSDRLLSSSDTNSIVLVARRRRAGAGRRPATEGGGRVCGARSAAALQATRWDECRRVSSAHGTSSRWRGVGEGASKQAGA
jgi:hypothetical protein